MYDTELCFEENTRWVYRPEWVSSLNILAEEGDY
jgi:hypothetical protein